MSAVLGNYGRFDLSPVRGSGSYLWDDQQRKYLDFGTGIAVASLGHAPDCIAKACAEQSAKLVHCSNLYHIQEQEELALLFNEKIMHREGSTFFCNSGAEANEALIKLARRYGSLHDPQKRSRIITFEGSFHGRTMAGISATGQDKVKNGFGELLPGFVHLPFNDIKAYEAELAKGGVLAVLLEPIQGEGGIHPATPEFLIAIGKSCQEGEPLLLVDEVQSGFGRTGQILSWHSIVGKDPDFEPDAVSWAKGMGGGFPVGATWISDHLKPSVSEMQESVRLNEVLGPGTHGTTYGGSPLASAVSLAVLREILDNDLAENAALMGQRLLEGLSSLESPLIKEVRGAGLILGLVLNQEAVSSLPGSGDRASISMVKLLMEKGLLTVPAGDGVVRLLPALNVSGDEVDEALEILAQVFA